MDVGRVRLYCRGSVLAVRGGGDDDTDGNGDAFWLCKAVRHVFSDSVRFDVQWMERDDSGGEKGFDRYRICPQFNSAEAATVICKVRLARAVGSGGCCWFLKPSQKGKIAKEIRKQPWRRASSTDGSESEEDEVETAGEKRKRKTAVSKEPAAKVTKKCGKTKAKSRDRNSIPSVT